METETGKGITRQAYKGFSCSQLAQKLYEFVVRFQCPVCVNIPGTGLNMVVVCGCFSELARGNPLIRINDQACNPARGGLMAERHVCEMPVLYGICEGEMESAETLPTSEAEQASEPTEGDAMMEFFKGQPAS